MIKRTGKDITFVSHKEDGVIYNSKVNGLSVKYNQLIDKSGYPTSQTINGITFTNNGDGSITANGTATQAFNFNLTTTIPAVVGHKYLLTGTNLTNNSIRVACFSGFMIDNGGGKISTAQSNWGASYISTLLTIDGGAVLNNVKLVPILVNLTAIGLDNITTVEQFNATDLGKLLAYRGYLDYTSENKIINVENIRSDKSLPSEYQAVEYIEAHGTQCINSGFSATQDNLQIDLKVISSYMNASTSIFGSSARSPYNLGLYSGYFYAGLTSGDGYPIRLSNDILYDIVINAKNNKLNIKINGISQTELNYNGSVAGNQNKNIYIFAGDGGSQKSSAKIYYFKIYDNDILVRYMIPCYRKSDNVIGMYDLVNDVFYTNQGTGTFTKGQNVVAPNMLVDFTLPTIVNGAIKQNIGLLSAGSVYDVYKNGVIERKIGVIDLGSLNWTRENNHYYSNPISSMYLIALNTQIGNAKTSNLTTISYSNLITEAQDKTIAISNSKRIYIYNTSITQASDITGLFIYELATPYTELSQPLLQHKGTNHIVCDNDVEIEALDYIGKYGNKYVEKFDIGE